MENYFSKIENSYGISPLPEKTVNAMAYIPYQSEVEATYTPEEGMEAGTMFPALDKPFEGETISNFKGNFLEE